MNPETTSFTTEFLQLDSVLNSTVFISKNFICYSSMHCVLFHPSQINLCDEDKKDIVEYNVDTVS